jgi:hypothetical protein
LAEGNQIVATVKIENKKDFEADIETCSDIDETV